MRSIRITWFLLLLLALAYAQGTSASCVSTQSLVEGYGWLDEIRASAGLEPFGRRVELELAARDHAAYLAQHRTTSHAQLPGRRGFTGETPSDRARARGYSANASENVSYGHADVRASIDGLMAAIYHRINFLDIERDEIGIAGCKGGGSYAFTYNLGSSGLARLCDRPRERPIGRVLIGLCAQSRRMLPEADVALWRAEVTSKSPDIIVWPPPDRVVDPVFFEEIPDPLPDLAVSGYPVSIQAHPGRFTTLELERFSVALENGDEVRRLRVLDVDSDPHGKLGRRDVVIFPLRRLEWDRRYRVRATVRLDGESRELDWRFRTARADGELIELEARMPYHVIEPGVRYDIYAPPPAFARLADGVSWRYPAGVTLETSFQDANTLILTVKGRACAPIELRLEDGTQRFDASAASGC